ncbi:2-oxoglutarate dehydrogenase, E2 component, dihydrolipoamide succinyltransferase [Phytohabitans sp. ZYX-F-186]|uniref:Dihydrolipoamide acetyltransferase component of pyruvate dehydrogenase complex n=1 Tax=Phytohabitans maris TaxID=3071409 RepID=A0ABU0ZIV4_9ACTN|nr:2-oxoglutarate dehydrogenase, E2 component, dihydrolipoamide succinyltransferase [Phytohabitans sp. ZYX-F-186]MDQ7905887.1 2-oxoglutarate dehydrogenase, E2 component, dihydrolipoamide succinyltransferase [Phytohabitans sp. ZYX-F-186]
MPVSVPMPRLGESVTEGTITRWLKQEGDRVEVDEPLLEVSTDKVDTEIPSPAAGVLTRIVVHEDETAEVGAELAVISGDDEGSGAAPTETPQETQQPEAAAPAPQEAPAQPSRQEPAPVQAVAAPPAQQPTGQDETPAQQQGGGEPGASGGTTVVKMPALGESVTEGTVTRWLKQVGENVDLDEPLLEVSTDKVDTEIPSPAGGTLLEIKVQQDETADVGADLAVIGSAGVPAEGHATESAPPPAVEAVKAEATPTPQPKPAPQPQAQPAPPAPTPAPAPQAQPQPSGVGARTAQANGGDTAYVTPLVRKLASEHKVDLATLNGTGVGGRIRKQDVLEAAEKAKAAAAAPAPAPAQPAAQAAPAPAPAKAEPSPLRGRTEKLTRTRISIAKRMYESLQSSAQLTTVVEVDVTRIARLRQQAKGTFQQQHGVKLSFLPFFAVAAVEALRRYPIVNASIDLDGGTVTYPEGEHLGIAVDTERGLLVPVIRDAGDLNLAGLARRIADLAERTRTNKISPDEISGATFTITNTGSRGALFDTPIVPKPQSAILGTGAVVKRAVVVDDPDLGEVITPRSMCYLALSYDHRIIDGADAARFLSAVKERLEAGHFEPDLGLA